MLSDGHVASSATTSPDITETTCRELALSRILFVLVGLERYGWIDTEPASNDEYSRRRKTMTEPPAVEFAIRRRKLKRGAALFQFACISLDGLLVTRSICDISPSHWARNSK